MRLYIYITFLAFIVSGCKQHPKSPATTAVKIKDEAIETALPHIIKNFPSASKSPSQYSASLEGDIWHIYPKLEHNELGGGPSADIDAKNMTLIRTYFSE